MRGRRARRAAKGRPQARPRSLRARRRGAWSPPMASTAMVTLSGIPNPSLAKRSARDVEAPDIPRAPARGGPRGQDRVRQSLAASAARRRRAAGLVKKTSRRLARDARRAGRFSKRAGAPMRRRVALVRLDDFAALVVAAVRAHAVRELHFAALRAHGTRGGVDAVVAAAAGMGAGTARLALGYCMVYLLLEAGRPRPPAMHLLNARTGMVPKHTRRRKLSSAQFAQIRRMGKKAHRKAGAKPPGGGPTPRAGSQREAYFPSKG